MLLVFEGPDGGGKSTLAIAVQKALDATRVHCGPPAVNHAWEQWTSIVAMAHTLGPNVNVVCDRLHWGDPVYAPIYRSEVGRQLTDEDIQDINNEIARYGGAIVYVTATPEVLESRFDGEYINTEHLPEIVNEYERMVSLAEDGECGVIVIDTSDGFDNFGDWVWALVTYATNVNASIERGDVRWR